MIKYNRDTPCPKNPKILMTSKTEKKKYYLTVCSEQSSRHFKSRYCMEIGLSESVKEQLQKVAFLQIKPEHIVNVVNLHP